MQQTDEIDRTHDWYESVLGFRCQSAAGDTWLRLVRDDVTIMFMRNDHLGRTHTTATQYIYVDDVMALWTAVQVHCSAEWGPERMPYGVLELAVRDPNGYLLRFEQRGA